eukprot:1842803-Amphidinium_carterae.1
MLQPTMVPVSMCPLSLPKADEVWSFLEGNRMADNHGAREYVPFEPSEEWKQWCLSGCASLLAPAQGQASGPAELKKGA